MYEYFNNVNTSIIQLFTYSSNFKKSIIQIIGKSMKLNEIIRDKSQPKDQFFDIFSSSQVYPHVLAYAKKNF